MATAQETALRALVEVGNILTTAATQVARVVGELRAALPDAGTSTGTTPPTEPKPPTGEPAPPTTGEPAPSEPVPTTPPTTPPSTGTPAPTTPPASGGSAGLGLSGVEMVGDDFASYPDVATFLKSPKLMPSETKHPELFALDKTTPFNGHQSLRANQPGGTANQPSFSFAFPAKSKVWARATLRFDAKSGKWSAYGQPGGDASVKLLSLGIGGNMDGRGGVHTANGHNLQLFVDAMPRGGPDPFPATYAERVVNGAVQVGAFSLITLGTELTDRRWYDIVVCIENLTNAEALAAIAKAPALYPQFTMPGKALPAAPCLRGRLWFGLAGAPALVGVFMAPIVGSAAIVFNRMACLENFNQPRLPGQDQAVLWGRAEVVDGAAQSNPFKVAGA